MSASCCHVDTNTNASTPPPWHAVLLLASGIFMFSPTIEAWLLSTLVGHITLSLIVSLCLYGLIEGFSQHRAYLIGMTLSLTLCVSSPMLPINALLQTAVMLFGFAVSLLQVMTQTTAEGHLKMAFPAVDKIIILFVLLNTLSSLVSISAFSAGLFEFCMHDGLITLGIFRLSHWIKSRMVTTAIENNHAMTVTVSTDNGHINKPIAALRLNDQVIINGVTQLPMTSNAGKDGVIIGDDASETRQSVSEGTKIPAYTRLYQGTVICGDPSSTPQSIAFRPEPKDQQLSLFLTLSLIVALGLGVYHAIIFQSIFHGLELFCVNLMILCPCVFLVTKPILMHKAVRWLHKHAHMMLLQMPIAHKPDIMVFDRTHTLYHPNPDDPDGPYVLAHGTRQWMGQLKDQGIQLYILSGHGTERWQEHLNACQIAFQDIIPKEHIIFNKAYHDPSQAQKSTIITQLQQYGSLTNKNVAASPFKVAMIGDGQNDERAMAQADLAIYVTKNVRNLNDRVAPSAHFMLHANHLDGLPSLCQAMTFSQEHINFCIRTSLLISITMMLLVNGGFDYLWGHPLSSGLACMTMSLLCLGMIAYASFATTTPEINHEQHHGLPSSSFAANKCCHHCHHEKHHSNPHQSNNDPHPKSPFKRHLGAQIAL